ncbi:MAG: hypothetical protein NTY69_08990 [Methylococcales bacterium]|nr:hypothetical protein [Methylococcales bacterium]
MQAIRQIYQNTPSIIHINIPEELQNHPVEVIIIALDSYVNKDIEIKETDSNGWPIGFFEATAGCLADDPIERAPQGDYETRLELE